MFFRDEQLGEKGRVVFPFEFKQMHIPSQLLPFDDRGPLTLATARAGLLALGRSYFNMYNCGVISREFDRH